FRSLCRPDICHSVIGIRAHRGGFELIVVEAFSGNGDGHRRSGEHFVQLDSVNQKASGDADEEQVQTGRNAAPEMNLKQCSPRPHALRASPELLDKRRAIAHCDPCTYRLGFKRMSRPTRYKTTASTRRGISPSASE